MFSSIAKFSTCCVLLLCLAGVVSAGPTLLQDVSGSAALSAGHQMGKSGSATAAIDSSSQALNARDEMGDGAQAACSVINLENRAAIAIDMEADAAAMGHALGEVSVSFTTTRAMNYRLTLAGDSADGALTAALDGRRLKVSDDFLGSGAGGETRALSGVLLPGTHTYTVTAASGFDMIYPMSSDGQTRLELAAAVPLPSAIWPGLGLFALAMVRLHRLRLRRA